MTLCAAPSPTPTRPMRSSRSAKARAIEMHARQARNVEAERRACEIRLRAERCCGQILREMEKAKAGRPPENRSHDARDFRGILSHPKTVQRWAPKFGQVLVTVIALVCRI